MTTARGRRMRTVGMLSLLAACFALVAVGCKRDRFIVRDTFTADASGTWTGLFFSGDPTGVLLDLTLDQTSNQVSGTFDLGGGEVTGSVTGTVSDVFVSFTVSAEIPCVESVVAVGVVDADAMRFNTGIGQVCLSTSPGHADLVRQ